MAYQNQPLSTQARPKSVESTTQGTSRKIWCLPWKSYTLRTIAYSSKMGHPATYPPYAIEPAQQRTRQGTKGRQKSMATQKSRSKPIRLLFLEWSAAKGLRGTPSTVWKSAAAQERDQKSVEIRRWTGKAAESDSSIPSENSRRNQRRGRTNQAYIWIETEILS